MIYDPKAATVRVGSDSYGCTVLSRCFESGYDTITVRADRAKPGPGHDYYATQVWEHSPNPKGETYIFRFSQGKWQNVKRNPKTKRLNATKDGCRLVVGTRETHQDPSF